MISISSFCFDTSKIHIWDEDKRVVMIIECSSVSAIRSKQNETNRIMTKLFISIYVLRLFVFVVRFWFETKVEKKKLIPLSSCNRNVTAGWTYVSWDQLMPNVFRPQINIFLRDSARQLLYHKRIFLRKLDTFLSMSQLD